MRPLGLLGPALFLAGVAAIVLATLRGEASVALVLIFPVITATGALGLAGMALLIGAFLVSFLTWPWIAGERPRPVPAPGTAVAPRAPSASRWGGVAFVGPIPIVFGSDPRMSRAMLILGILLFVALLVFMALAWTIG